MVESYLFARQWSRSKRVARYRPVLAVFGAFLCVVGRVHGQSPSKSNYVIGPQDVLNITVSDDPTLNGHYTVQNDGTFTILGLQSPIKAAGMTVQAFETELKRRFVADGYFTHPQLTVSVEQYKSKKVYVYGEIRAPAAYPLTGGMTLIEAIMMAGGPSSANPGQAIVVRAHGGGAAGTPTVAVHDGDGADADIIHVDISKWQDGAKDKYLPLEDGDIIQVMQAENVFMFGEVNHQGAYPVTRTSTVQQMLTVAGGFTIDAATGEVRIVRMVNGKKTEIKVKSDKFPLELVKPGDTIVVRARRF